MLCVCAQYDIEGISGADVATATTSRSVNQADTFFLHYRCSRAVDGGWSSWQRWSQVTVTCGVGMRERRRRCDNPRPNFCGRACRGDELERDMYDTRAPCPLICGK